MTNLNDIKHEMDKSIAGMSEQIVIFEQKIDSIERRFDAFASQMVDMDQRILSNTDLCTKTKQALGALEDKASMKTAVNELASRTKRMVDTFNDEVDDLRNQIDTTDTYIENYLPMRSLKEITYVLEHAQFDRKNVHAI